MLTPIELNAALDALLEWELHEQDDHFSPENCASRAGGRAAADVREDIVKIVSYDYITPHLGLKIKDYAVLLDKYPWIVYDRILKELNSQNYHVQPE